MGPSFAHFELDPACRLRNTVNHSFIETVMCAYCNHLPLVLSPDDVWTTILQGFSIFMECNFEPLCDKFVDFDGKKRLEIQDEHLPDLFDPKADWDSAFSEWADMVRQNIGVKNHARLVPNFSRRARCSSKSTTRRL